MARDDRDYFADGTACLVKVLRPRGEGWSEGADPRQFTRGFPARSFHHNSGLFVISAVETTTPNDGVDLGYQYHVSISRPVRLGVTRRCTSQEAKWVLRQFNFEAAWEDNHVPSGQVRNFWRPVASPLVGIQCECVDEEPAIVEDRGDYVWRGAPAP